MPQTAVTAGAADLLVHGTYALRRALGLLARPGMEPAEQPADERLPGDPPVERAGRSGEPAEVAAAHGR